MPIATSAPITCPTCSTATLFHKPPIEICAHCGTPYPLSVRIPAEEELGSKRNPRPLLLLILSALMLLFTSTGVMMINGSLLTTMVLLRAVLPLAASAAIAYGIWIERSWVRPLLLLTLGCGALYTIAKQDTLTGAVAAAIVWFFPIVFILWYLLRKANVVAYFRSLEAREALRAEAAVAQRRASSVIPP